MITRIRVLLIYTYIVFSFVIVNPIYFGISFYGDSVVGGVLLLFYILFLAIVFERKPGDRTDLLGIIILLLVCLRFINSFFIVKKYIIETIIMTVPILLLLFFIRDDVIQANIERIRKLIVIMCCMVTVLSTVIYLLGYSQLYVTLQGINFIKTEELIYSFGETRLSLWFFHKARFGLICIISAYFILDSKLNIIFKVILSGMIVFNVFSSSSATTFAGIGIVFLIYALKLISKIEKKYFRNIFIVVLIESIIITGIFAFLKLSEHRDVGDLGDRSIIWQYAIERAKDFPFGQGVKFEYFDSFKFSNGHNLFLNEILRNGVIPGMLLILAIITIFVRIARSRMYMELGLFMALCIMGMLDDTWAFATENVVWHIISYLLIICYYSFDHTKEKLMIGTMGD